MYANMFQSVLEKEITTKAKLLGKAYFALMTKLKFVG